VNAKSPCTHPWGLSSGIPAADALLITLLSLPLSFNVACLIGATQINIYTQTNIVIPSHVAVHFAIDFPVALDLCIPSISSQRRCYKVAA
jgi:hypothetical protein